MAGDLRVYFQMCFRPDDGPSHSGKIDTWFDASRRLGGVVMRMGR